MNNAHISGGSVSPANPIQIDQAVLAGKPFIHGTRLSVEFLQGLLATGWSRERVLGVYQYLTEADMDAVGRGRIS